MSHRSAVILAAGNARRMGAITSDLPKALLEVDGGTLVDRQLEALECCGIDDVTMVVGYQQQRLREHLGNRVRFVENPRHDETNSLYSLWLAREHLRGGALVLNADVLVATELLAPLIHASVEDAVLVDRTGTLGEEEMKVKLREDFVVDFGKEFAPLDADGENVGILKFGAEGSARLTWHLGALVNEGMLSAWAPRAFRALAQEWPLRAIDTGGTPWIEIDFPEDLDRARQVIAPAIAAHRSRNAGRQTPRDQNT